MKRMIWRIYTWIYHLFSLVLELLPMFLRDIVFRLMFGKCGKIALIDYGTYFRYPHKMRIGKQVSINRGCKFLASAHSSEKYDIVIGDRCVFAPDVKLLSAGHDYQYIDLPDTAAVITIGDDVWIGAGATVLQGVTIGTGAVVGAGSVVTKDIPAWSVAVGNPAHVIKERKCKEHE